MSEEETTATKGNTHGKSQSARNAAINRLIAEFGDRWTELHAEERKARGLFPVLKKEKQATREELKTQNEKLRAVLAAHGVNPDEV